MDHLGSFVESVRAEVRKNVEKDLCARFDIPELPSPEGFSAYVLENYCKKHKLVSPYCDKEGMIGKLNLTYNGYFIPKQFDGTYNKYIIRIRRLNRTIFYINNNPDITFTLAELKDKFVFDHMKIDDFTNLDMIEVFAYPKSNDRINYIIR